jgi:hypothetical protein
MDRVARIDPEDIGFPPLLKQGFGRDGLINHREILGVGLKFGRERLDGIGHYLSGDPQERLPRIGH